MMIARILRPLVPAIVAAASLILSSCATAPTPGNTNSMGDSNSNSGAVSANTNSNTAQAPPPGSPESPFAAREPDRYSLVMTVSGQGSSGDQQRNLPPLQIEFARRDDDRRWSFQVPALGPVIYLEKSGLKYLILPARKQYVEISPQALGFRVGDVLTPSAIVERLQAHKPPENLGNDVIDGRTATKYRFTGSASAVPQAGAVEAESLVYVDQETGLPLRADINLNSSSGAAGRGVIETKNIHLSPDPLLFEVPAGMKKVTSEELKQQLQQFIALIRLFAPAKS